MDATNQLTVEEKTPHPNRPPGVPGGRDQICYVALGSNLGDRQENISRAVEKLRETPGVTVLRVSTLLDNPAIGGPEQSPSFLNAVTEIRTMIPPLALLHRLLEIENQMGRVRREKWEPRKIDLDLILYGSQIIQTDELIVPHPLMHQRRFVLQPLAQLCPNLIHPTQGIRVTELLHRLPKVESLSS